MNNWLIIVLYWIACCIMAYVFRNRKGKDSLRKIAMQKTKLWEHLLIILLSPLAVPIIILVLVYNACKNLYYKNRPKPLPKSIRKFMKKDCVLDENDNTTSLTEYNYKHT